MTDSALETTLFAAAGTKQGHRCHAEPDWAEIHRELKRKHVTLTMLWDEYIERCPEGSGCAVRGTAICSTSEPVLASTDAVIDWHRRLG
jgi:hypothetical protein